MSYQGTFPNERSKALSNGVLLQETYRLGYRHFEKWASRECQTYPKRTSRMSINLEGVHGGNRPEESSRGTSRNERTTAGWVEGMMTSFIQLKCSSQERLLWSLWENDQILWGPRRINLLKRVCTSTITCLFSCPFRPNWTDGEPSFGKCFLRGVRWFFWRGLQILS